MTSSKRRILVMSVALIALAYVGIRSATLSIAFWKGGYHRLGVGFLVEALVDFAAAILVATSHRTAIRFVRAAAILFTLGALVGGLSLRDALEVIAAWIGYWQYQGWRLESSLEKAKASI